MQQRTYNIIMCCKNNCGWPRVHVDPKGHAWADHIAAYMSHECACPSKDYTGKLLESIMKEALFDYLDSADHPGAELRRLFDWPGMGPEPAMYERIASVFSLAQIKDGKSWVNGFSEKLEQQSLKDLNRKPKGGKPDE